MDVGVTIRPVVGDRLQSDEPDLLQGATQVVGHERTVSLPQQVRHLPQVESRERQCTPVVAVPPVHSEEEGAHRVARVLQALKGLPGGWVRAVDREQGLAGGVHVFRPGDHRVP